MFSLPIPMPVFFAAVAFTLLLVEPEIGSSASHIVTPCAAVASPGAQPDAGLWLGYRAASRQWAAAKPAALGGSVMPSPLR
jgi:hypothetical protein